MRRCPGCRENALRVRDRVRVAARANARCPACGIAIRFGTWPRIVHTLFGDAMLLGGLLGGFILQAPFFLFLASGSWLSLALLLPVESARRGESSDAG